MKDEFIEKKGKTFTRVILPFFREKIHTSK